HNRDAGQRKFLRPQQPEQLHRSAGLGQRREHAAESDQQSRQQRQQRLQRTDQNGNDSQGRYHGASPSSASTIPFSIFSFLIWFGFPGRLYLMTVSPGITEKYVPGA